jgi:glyoxylase-like metal-dependent hydrolase (beta-lactamase superfamily II)
MTDAPDYEVHAIRYAHDQRRRLSENFLTPLTEPRDLHDSLMPMDFFVWLIVGGGRTIVVDTGFDRAVAARRGRDIVQPVEDGLAALGATPETVTDVILTHLHWDHAGNNDLFPKHRYHVQDREMAFCTGRCMCHPFARRPFDVEDVTAMVRRIYAGNVQFHDQTSEVAPGVTLHWVGGHSLGLQVVRVKTARGHVVLASDAVHYYANMDQARPFPLITDLQEMLDGFKTCVALGSSPAHVVPGHDPLVMREYPASRSGLADCVRLDVAPKKLR